MSQPTERSDTRSGSGPGSGSGSGPLSRFDDWLDEETSPRRALLVYVVLAFYYLIILFPIIYLLLSTFKSQSALFAGELIIVPTGDQFTLSHWARVLTRGDFQLFAINSVIIATTTTVLTLAVSIFGAYAISRFEFPGSKSMILAFVSTQMLPGVLILIPFFSLMFTLGLINSYLGIVLAHSVGAIPFGVWLLKGYFDDIPESLDDAARMDGCSELGVILRVIVPLSAPGLSVAAFYTFVLSWNDYLFVSILSQSAGTRTLPFALELFQSSNAVDWGAVLTAAVITMAPVIVLFALVQRYIVEGLAQGGTKGF